MNRNYIKNYYIQQLEKECYIEVFEKSISTIISKKLIEIVTNKICEDSNEERTVKLFNLFNKLLNGNLYFHNKFKLSNIILLISKKRITMQTLKSFENLLDVYLESLKNIQIDNIEKTQIHDNFYNYYIYKKKWNNYTFDFEIKIDFENRDQLDLYLEIFKKICENNQESQPLLNYLNSLPKFNGKDNLISIVQQETNQNKLYISKEYNNLEYFAHDFLCFKNSENNICKICQRKINNGYKIFNIHSQLFYKFIDSKIESYFKTENFKQIDLMTSHYELSRCKENLEIILKLIFNKNDLGMKLMYLLKFYDLKCYEESIIGLIKLVDSENNIQKFRICLNVIYYMEFTDKISFAVFWMMFNGSCKYNNQHLKLILLNMINYKKRYFLKILPSIIEYFFRICTKDDELTLSKTLEPISQLFCLEGESFIEDNIGSIFPILYKNNLLEMFNEIEIFSNLKFLIISLIENNCFSTTDNYCGYELKDVIVDQGCYILVSLLYKGYWNEDLFEKIYQPNLKMYICNNLSPILFFLRSFSLDENFLPKICVFKTFKILIEQIYNCDNIEFLRCFDQIFPFIEAFRVFAENKQHCVYDKRLMLHCFDDFFKWFIAKLNYNFIKTNSHLIYPYLETERLEEFESQPNSVDKLETNLKIIHSLLSSKGLNSLEVAIEKVALLWKRIFNSGEDSIVKFINSYKKEYKYQKLFAIISNKLISLRKIYKNPNLSNMISNLGILNYDFSKSFNKNLKIKVICEDSSLDAIAKYLLEEVLINVEIENQEVFFFVIQESLKYLKSIAQLEEKTQRFVSQFQKTKYHLPISFTFIELPVYEDKIKYNMFVKRLFDLVLNEIKINSEDDITLKEYFKLLVFGNLFSTRIIEHYLICGIKILATKKNIAKIQNIIKKINERLISQRELIDTKILDFILKINLSTKLKIVEDDEILNISFYRQKYYHSLMVLETKTNLNDLTEKDWNNLQFAYYKVNDYDNVKGINSLFKTLNSVNLFFDFCMAQNFGGAIKCLQLIENEKNRNFSLDELQKILKSNESSYEDLNDIIEECKVARMHLAKWNDVQYIQKVENTIKNKKIEILDKFEENSNNNFHISALHFLKDCELILSSRDLKQTLKVITERRSLIKNNKSIIDLHCQLKIFESIETDKDSISNFIADSKLLKVRYYRKEKNFEKCMDEISKLFIDGHWNALYEYSKVFALKNQKNDSKESLKKLISLVSNNNILYEKALAYKAKLINSKESYKEAIKILNNSEKLYFYQAKILESKDPLRAIESYKQSLSLGLKYINESLPKIFHLFCEESGLSFEQNKDIYFQKCSLIIKEVFELIPSIHFLPFFNQIISKISISNEFVFSTISKILIILFNNHPFKTFWHSLIYKNSKEESNRKKFMRITDSLNYNSKVILKNINAFADACVFLGKLQGLPKSDVSIERDFKKMLEIVKLDVVVPDSQMNVKIQGIEDRVKVLHSIAKPKKINLIGENGKIYSLLCKPKDDLRKDSRFMDLCHLINHIFTKNEECQSRNLNIRTYNIIPIDNNNGIIEWIDGLETLRIIFDRNYKKVKLDFYQKAKIYMTNKTLTIDKFRKALEDFKPPQFYRWFVENFNDPFCWFISRERYIRTYACMNALGWFMDLGDRHLDNILMDVKTGDTVHVDLNCIFDSAKNLPIPEKVPFRLTQNIIDAFGILKIEGSYRKTLEISLETLAHNRDKIMANLLSFVYDPIFEWGSKTKKHSGNMIDSLSKKLEIDDFSQKADELINEATNELNLAGMYCGWQSFI